VLGTPGRNVYFTSLRNNAIGGNTDPTNFTGVQAGNWGGIVFRQESDVQGLDYQGKGIFLNSINQANKSPKRSSKASRARGKRRTTKSRKKAKA